MDAATISQQRYERPSVSDYGTLTELTADAGMLLGVGLAGLSGPLKPPDTPGGGGGGGGGGEGAVAGSFQVPEGGAQGGVVGEGAPGEGAPGDSVPAGAEAQGGGGAGGGGGSPVSTGGGDASLPFTGFAAAGVAGLGALLGGAGAAMRRAVRRRRHWR